MGFKFRRRQHVSVKVFVTNGAKTMRNVLVYWFQDRGHPIPNRRSICAPASPAMAANRNKSRVVQILSTENKCLAPLSRCFLDLQ